MNGYHQLITEATGVTHPEEVAEIEECMRQDIYHSTLDWQSREELMNAARIAMKVLEERFL